MHLLGLPQETLVQIFEYLDDHEIRPYTYILPHGCKTPSPFLPLGLVCRRLHLLAESYIYKRLQIYLTRDWSQQMQTSQGLITPLHALEKRPYRNKFVEILVISFREADAESLEKHSGLLAVLDKSSNVKICKVLGGESTVLTPILFHALDTKKIRELNAGVVNLDLLTKPGCLRHLTDLTISDIKSDASDQCLKWWEDYELPAERRRISPVQNLKVEWWMYREDKHPSALLPILIWIAALKYLYINFICHYNSTLKNFTGQQLQRLLDVHSATLERIELTSYEGLTIPSFRHFLKLSELRISYAGLFTTEPEEAASRLTAPLLSTFIIDFDWESPHTTYTQGFGSPYLVWLLLFIERYKQLMPESGIREIRLENVYCKYKNGNQALRDAREMLRREQIDFVWTTSVNKDDLEVDESDPLVSKRSEYTEPGAAT